MKELYQESQMPVLLFTEEVPWTPSPSVAYKKYWSEAIKFF